MKSLEFESTGYYHPEVLHTSFFISILIALAMVFSFRVKFLNIIAFAVFPSIIFTLFLHDLPIWIDPNPDLLAELGTNQVGDLFWWNYVTIHTPIPIVAAYVYFTREKTLSRESFAIGFLILVTWFVALDDKENGSIDGPLYIIIALPIMIVWTALFLLSMKNVKYDDPLIAPLIKVKKIRWVKRSKTEKVDPVQEIDKLTT